MIDRQNVQGFKSFHQRGVFLSPAESHQRDKFAPGHFERNQEARESIRASLLVWGFTTEPGVTLREEIFEAINLRLGAFTVRPVSHKIRVIRGWYSGRLRIGVSQQLRGTIESTQSRPFIAIYKNIDHF